MILTTVSNAQAELNDFFSYIIEPSKEVAQDSDLWSEFGELNISNERESSIIPDFACRYCGQQNPKCVARCNICKHWFCNAVTEGVNASHIIQHLVRSRHKEVQLHKESPLDETILECYNCGSRNVFILGFVPAKSDSIVILLCRSPCAYSQTCKEVDCDVSQWQPIITDRRFLSWIVKIPEDSDLESAHPVSSTDIINIEECLRSDQKEAFNFAHPESEDVPSAHLSYDIPRDFMNTYIPIINLEADYDKKLKESQSQPNVNIRVEVGLNRRYIVYFSLPPSDSDMRVMPGDELELVKTIDKKEKRFRGSITRLPNAFGEEIAMEMNHGFTTPSILTNWTVEFVWKPVTFERMKQALKIFSEEFTSACPYIAKKILGKCVEDENIKLILPKRFSAPGLPELNHSQVYAVKMALQKPLSLIQGPPGTGKTVTSSTLVYHLIKQCGGQVLVCAPSNIAVDQLAAKIHRTGLKVVRLCARSREAIDTSVLHLTLHHQVHTLEKSSELSKLMKLKEDQGQLIEEDQKRYTQLKYSLEKELLKNADVICCTCVGAGDLRLKGHKFRCVLLDESTQATEPECLIPVVLGTRQLILVGDHCQLGPVVMCKKAAAAGLKRSMFERMIELGIKPLRLQVQYRMHPALSEFSSNVFYDGTLQNGVTAVERSQPGVQFPWPVPEKPMFFYCCYGQEEISSSGTSYLNRTEAAAVETFTTRLMKGGVKSSQIGIITPYDGQRGYIVSYMTHSGHMSSNMYQNLEIASVDAFQGREKDYIIMSCVRSNEQRIIGFLNDSRRLNVAITRAKYGLIIIGNPRILCRHAMWNNLLNDYKDKGVLVEGTLGDLRDAQIILNKPLKTTKNVTSVAVNASIDEYFQAHDRLNVLGEIVAELPEGESNIPINVLIPPIPSSFTSQMEDISDEPNLEWSNDILSFARNISSFNLDPILPTNN